MGTRPKVISTFAGCGGSSLGYRLAGFDEPLAIDFDKTCGETFRLNFPETEFWQRDIKEVTAGELLAFVGMKVGELDLFDGSPPCQGFSVAGKRVIGDERNKLFLEFVRLIDGLQPKVFVMENVPGLAYGEMKGIYNDIMKKFGTLPYKVECKMLNAKYHGVAEARKRLIWVGIRKDLGKDPTFPEPKTKLVTVGEALAQVKEARDYAPLPKGASEIFPYVKRGNLGWRGIPQSLLYKYIPRTQKNKNFKYTAILRRLELDKPAYTVLSTFIEYSFNIPIHPTEDRYLSIEELKAVSSFPQDFELAGNFKAKWKQIGNAVPPNPMMAIAENIKREILDGEGVE